MGWSYVVGHLGQWFRRVLKGRRRRTPWGRERCIHPALGHHVHGGVGPGVAHVEALAGGIGELHQGIGACCPR